MQPLFPFGGLYNRQPLAYYRQVNAYHASRHACSPSVQGECTSVGSEVRNGVGQSRWKGHFNLVSFVVWQTQHWHTKPREKEECDDTPGNTSAFLFFQRAIGRKRTRTRRNGL